MLLLVFALFLMGALWTVVAPKPRVQAETYTTQQVEQGRALFAVGCSSCHGLNGEGQVAENIQGPPLVGVGAASVHFQVSTGRMPMAQPGPQAPKRPNLYSEEEVIALSAFVASLGPGPDIPTPEEYEPTNIPEEELARGGELFRTNCSACHNFEGAGGALPNGKYAPPLVGVDNIHLYEAMLTGPQQMPVFSDEVLTPENKRAIIGYLNELHEQEDRGGLALGGIGPVAEGFWTWTLGLGSLILASIWIAAKGAKAK